MRDSISGRSTQVARTTRRARREKSRPHWMGQGRGHSVAAATRCRRRSRAQQGNITKGMVMVGRHTGETGGRPGGCPDHALPEGRFRIGGGTERRAKHVTKYRTEAQKRCNTIPYLNTPMRRSWQCTYDVRVSHGASVQVRAGEGVVSDQSHAWCEILSVARMLRCVLCGHGAVDVGRAVGVLLNRNRNRSVGPPRRA